MRWRTSSNQRSAISIQPAGFTAKDAKVAKERKGGFSQMSFCNDYPNKDYQAILILSYDLTATQEFCL